MAETVNLNISDLNALEHITSDIAKSRYNYESILNGLVMWNTTKDKQVTVRLMTDSDPFFVDYTFPSRSANVKDSDMFLGPDIREGSFDCINRLSLPASGSYAGEGDRTTLRITLGEGTGNSWRLFEDAMVYPDGNIPEGCYYRSGKSVVLKTADGPKAAIVKWTPDMQDADRKGLVALYNAHSGNTMNAYIRLPESSQVSPLAQNWELFAMNIDAVANGENVVHGRPYLYYTQPDFSDAGIYIYTGNTVTKTDAGPKPYYQNPTDPTQYDFDSTAWYGPVVLVPTAYVSGTTIVRDRPGTDIRGYMLQSLTVDGNSLYVKGNVSVPAGEAEPHRGVGMYGTCNYAHWPEDTSAVWDASSTSNTATATMVFHHASDDAKRTNIVNYDGPDIDGGLKVYLPVMDETVSGFVTPVDGCMVEFMFRIWPEASLNGHETADLTINKAQVYVLSAPTSSDLSGSKVIAKFSMARLTNFYVWSENVAVPNRPVFYKARFVYSKADDEWKTWDYYQVPDHVFLSPKGFVDPADRESDGGYTGVETAGFPLMQDPFGGMDMSPVQENQ